VPKLPIPGPVLEIIAGIVLGPAVLDVVQVDPTVRAAAILGLAFLLFLAGLEIDVAHFRGPRARQALGGTIVSVVLGVGVGYGLHAAGLVQNGLLVGIALMATSLGLVVPILKDAGVIERPVGQLTIAGASAGDVTAVVLLSLLFSEHVGPLGGRLLLLGLLLLVAVVIVLLVLRAEHSMHLGDLLSRLADTTAQIRVRLAVLTVVGFAAFAARLGFEAILGAFIAGALLRLVDADAMTKHPRFQVKLDGIGYGFLIPVFFVTSGVTFDLDALTGHPATLLRVPLFLALLLLVRGVPALFYLGALGRRQTLAAALLQATSLPFIVAATQIGLALHAISSANAAALVAAGLVSVLVYPALALRLLAERTEPARVAQPN
ncbi:MAG: cation:proton antiporter, partial [Actinomycetota bacterium]|nr:cation:proton antiporter [Actinomycetota bacterium]